MDMFKLYISTSVPDPPNPKLHQQFCADVLLEHSLNSLVRLLLFETVFGCRNTDLMRSS